eukprot:6524206-Alexandrium_andersonii.AAC.1
MPRARSSAQSRGGPSRASPARARPWSTVGSVCRCATPRLCAGPAPMQIARAARRAARRA